jgi:hypothetical protein
VVSGFNREPINSIIDPIDTFNASANGISKVEKDFAFDKFADIITGFNYLTLQSLYYSIV